METIRAYIVEFQRNVVGHTYMLGGKRRTSFYTCVSIESAENLVEALSRGIK